MTFDELDQKMRVFETAHDHSILPGIFIVARLDGRGFTRLTKELHNFEAPFDVRMRDMMVETVQHLMDCGFSVLYGYTQSDEISLLFHPAIETFNANYASMIRSWPEKPAPSLRACWALMPVLIRAFRNCRARMM